MVVFLNSPPARGRPWGVQLRQRILNTWWVSYQTTVHRDLGCLSSWSGMLQAAWRKQFGPASTASWVWFLTGETPPSRSLMGRLICFLLKKKDVLHIPGYRPVCLLDTVYKVLSAIITDRLYWLAERHGLLDPLQEGFRRLHSTQRQVQSLHWGIQETVRVTLRCRLELNMARQVDRSWLVEDGAPHTCVLRWAVPVLRWAAVLRRFGSDWSRRSRYAEAGHVDWLQKLRAGAKRTF